MGIYVMTYAQVNAMPCDTAISADKPSLALCQRNIKKLLHRMAIHLNISVSTSYVDRRIVEWKTQINRAQYKKDAPILSVVYLER